jgi:hypothetical protein
MTDKPEPQDIDEALFMLQQDPPVLVKDQDGQVGSQKTKYADLVQANEKILARLTDLGVLWKTKPTTIMIPGPNGQQDPRFVLTYQLKHIASGTTEEGIYPLPAGANPMQNGSAITYARRYALIAVTNTVAEGMDDDGQGYGGRAGMAQRANVRQQQSVAQRAERPAPAPRPERSRPAQQPELPPTTGGPQGPPAGQAPEFPGEPHRGRGGLITEPMVRKLVVSMKDCGIVGDARLPYVADLVNRPDLKSSKDLTFDEGRALIDALEKAKVSGADDLGMKAAQIYIRITTGEEELTPPPAKRAAKRAARPAETRTQRQQTRDAVLGNPNGAGADEAPPWDDEPPSADPADEWPPAATPGGSQ